MYDKKYIINSLEDTIKMIEKMSSEEFVQKMKEAEKSLENLKNIEKFDECGDLKFVFEPFENSPCKNCNNNPKNGGSGICHCILGNPTIHVGW